jgi:hypothetical protein
VVRESMRVSRILAEISGSRPSAGAPTRDRVTPVTAARQRPAARTDGTRRRPAAATRSKNVSRRSWASSAAGGRRPGRPEVDVAVPAAAHVLDRVVGARQRALVGQVEVEGVDGQGREEAVLVAEDLVEGGGADAGRRGDRAGRDRLSSFPFQDAGRDLEDLLAGAGLRVVHRCNATAFGVSLIQAVLRRSV